MGSSLLRGFPAAPRSTCHLPPAARLRRVELAIAVATCVGVLAFNILYGVLMAIGLSVADLLVRVARPHDALLGLVPGLAGMHALTDYPRARTIPGLVVYRYDADPSSRRSASPPSTGACSTSRPMSRWTSPRWKYSTPSARRSPAGARSSPWPASSRTCWRGCGLSAWPTPLARNDSSRPPHGG